MSPKPTHQPCGVPGCKRRPRAKGLCWAHYMRDRRKPLARDASGALLPDAPAFETERFTVRLTTEIAKKLRQLAREHQDTVPSRIEAAVEQFMREIGR